MGSIQYIYKPDEWKIIVEGKNKLVENDTIYKMNVGYCDDELSIGDINIFISKSNYENILNGKYIIKIMPYSLYKVVILDKDNNIIPLVNGICDEEYNNQIKKVRK